MARSFAGDLISGGDLETPLLPTGRSMSSGLSALMPFDFGSKRSDGASSSSSISGMGGSRANYVGLSNQGATCYLNSLLQTLFMTPEFRNALYNWEHDDKKDDPKDDCIPFQLQKLFGMLQHSKSRAVETKGLTASFGWSGAQAFQQHDVQELCRVLFDVCERTFKGTSNATLINDLYQGKMRDGVTCVGCGTNHSHTDSFLDVSLVIQPFGTQRLNGSVGQALDSFLQQETLDGDNQYFCEVCNSKQDATKGLAFESLPYFLSLQLKRFDFDMQTLQRRKLNNKVEFPLYLDMSRYIRTNGNTATDLTADDGADAATDAAADAAATGYEGKATEEDNAAEGAGVVETETEAEAEAEGKAGAEAESKAGAGAEAEVGGSTDVDEIALQMEAMSLNGFGSGSSSGGFGSSGSGGTAGQSSSEGGGAAATATAEEDEMPPLVDSVGVVCPPSRAEAAAASLERYQAAEAKRRQEAAAKRAAAEAEAKEAAKRFRGCGGDVVGGASAHVYELFSVLVHSGGTTGGHYYAYIKNLDDGKWMTFNDSSVTSMTEADVMKAWGGGGGYGGSANAYMVMYRQVDGKRNQRFLGADSVPDHVLQLLAKEEEEKKQRQQELSAANRRMPLKVTYNGEERVIHVDKQAVVAEAIRTAWIEFGLTSDAFPDPGPITAPSPSDAEAGAGAAERAGAGAETGSADAAADTATDTTATDTPANDTTVAETPTTDATTAADTGADSAVEESTPADATATGESGGEADPKSVAAASGVALEDCRLRAFSVYYNIAQDTYAGKEYETLQSLNWFNYKTLLLETREAGAPFPAYDPTSIPLLLHKLNRERGCFDDPVTIAISATATLGQLRRRVCELFGYPLPTEAETEADAETEAETEAEATGAGSGTGTGAGTAADAATLLPPLFPAASPSPAPDGPALPVRILKLQSGGYVSPSTLLTGEEKELRKGLFLYQGMKLYCELATEEELQAPLADSAAVTVYRGLANTIVVKFNRPGAATADETVRIDKRKTVADLRIAIGLVVGLEPDAFKLHRMSILGSLLKDDRMALGRASVVNHTTLWVEEGRALKKGEFNCQIFLYTPPYSSGIQHRLLGAEQTESEAEAGAEADAGAGSGAEAEAGTEAEAEAGTEAEAAAGAEAEAEAEAAAGAGAEAEAGTKGATDESEAAGDAGKKEGGEGNKEEEEEDEAVEAAREAAAESRKQPDSTWFTSLFSMPISNDTQVATLRTALHEKLVQGEFLPPTSTPDRVRIRTKVHYNAATCLRDGTTVKSSCASLYDGKQFAVQLLPAPETLLPTETVVMLQVWDRDTWRLRPRQEVTFPKASRGCDLAQALSAVYRIPLPSLRVAKHYSYQSMELLMLPQEAWLAPAQDTRGVNLGPMFLGDGDRLLVQNVDTPLKLLSQPERAAMQLPVWGGGGDLSFASIVSGGSGSGSGSSGGGVRRREQGLRIRTHAEREAEAQQAEEKRQAAAAAAEAGAAGSGAGDATVVIPEGGIRGASAAMRESLPARPGGYGSSDDDGDEEGDCAVTDGTGVDAPVFTADFAPHSEL